VRGDFMVKIHKKQFETNDTDNFQERTIEYSSFEKYIEDLENETSVMECAYPSIPRCTKIEQVTKGSNFITFQFRHRLMNSDIKHIAEVVK
jgi:hypothetical protein